MCTRAGGLERDQHLYWANVFHKSDVAISSPAEVLAFAQLATLATDPTSPLAPPELHAWDRFADKTTGKSADESAGNAALARACWQALNVSANGHEAFGLDHVHVLYSDGTVDLLANVRGLTTSPIPLQFVTTARASTSRKVGFVARVQTSFGQCEMLFAPSVHQATTLQVCAWMGARTVRSFGQYLGEGSFK